MASNFVTYNSSAGSGKTFTLVKEYLKIALENENPNQYRQILAITFTNKAAAEMKERVLGALEALSSGTHLEGGPKFLQEALMLPVSEGGLGIGAEAIAERSAKVLQSILHNYNDFGISTIDKFTHRIIRSFAHDLQLPLNFNIELDEEEVLKASIDMLITEIGENEKLTKLMVDYAVQKSDDEKSWSVERDLLDFSKKLLREDGELYLEKVRDLTISDFEDIREYLFQQIGAFEKKVKEMVDQAMDFLKQSGIHHDSFSRSFYPAYWLKMVQKGEFEPTATMLKIMDGEQNWYAARVDAAQKELIDRHQDELIRMFEASRKFVQEQEGDYILHRKLAVNLYNMAVLNEIEKALLEFKQENNLLNISDFNKRIATIVATEPVPFIYERLGEKYQHYLIDEFQDTSVVQWHNLLPLVDNSLANGKFNMIVGDAKQAIYRWRGGELEQLLHFPKLYRHDDNPILIERQTSLERNYEERELKDNYRSKAEIVDFNNCFFHDLSGRLSEEYRSLYAGLQQGFNDENRGGGISVLFTKETDNQLYKEFNLKQITNAIQDCLQAGYEWKDIAVLTRGNEDANRIAAYLLAQNIQVVSSESLLLDHAPEVQFVLSVLRFLTNPADLNYEVSALRYLTRQVYHEDLFEVKKRYPQNLFVSYLKEKGIHIDYKQISNYDLYELVEDLFVKFGLDREVDIYLQFFLDKVYEYAAKNDHSILNFLEWWETRSGKFSIVIPEGAQAVQVMTIHKSKGLEFPVVIFPFADSRVKRSEDFFWTEDTKIEQLKAAVVPMGEDLLQTSFAPVYEKEMEKSRLDLINLLYVAFTRPKDRLYVVTRLGKESSKHGTVGEYLYHYCASQPEFDSEQLEYRFGIFAPNASQVRADQPSEVVKNLAYNNWRDKISISYQAPKVWEVENPEGIGEQGQLVHYILSRLATHRELPAVLDDCVLKGVIEEEERKPLEESLSALFEVEAIKFLFEDMDELKNERPILTPRGEMYQPDRVVVKSGRTYLVDFKTGERDASHEVQVRNYRGLLQQMGYSNIKAMLLYVKEAEIQVVE
ncbi:MAG: UvrD-helicase domain-containing protein [Flavobacteriales bacterium]|nr:UvrD-helicase domain-containing protein [Flavobacteriales bacterium]